jgi:DUF917 family protein
MFSRLLELAFQNASAVGRLDGAPHVMTPDLIRVMDARIKMPCYGRCVRVVAPPAAPLLMLPKTIEHVGPRAFRYDVESSRACVLRRCFDMREGHSGNDPR